MASVGLTSFVNRALVRKASSIVHSTIVGMSWITYPYFEGPVFFFLNVLILPVINISLSVLSIMATLSGPIPRRMIPSFGSGVDDGRVGRDVAEVHHLNFLIRAFFNNVTLLSTL